MNDLEVLVVPVAISMWNVGWRVCSFSRQLANILVTLLPLLYHMWCLEVILGNPNYRLLSNI